MIIEEKFQEALHQCYQSYRQLPRLFLEEKLNISQTFTHVALLKKQTVRDAEKKLHEEKTGWDDARLYSHETLYAEHDYVDLDALFSPLRGAEKRPDDVVVWGRAGIGKSVLCQYIATQWRQNESLSRLKNEFKAVIWLKLREVIDVLSKQDVSSWDKDEFIWRVLKLIFLKSRYWKKEEEDKKEGLLDWLETNRQAVLFLCDGYDEIAGFEQDCLWIKTFWEGIFYYGRVLLTSRPLAIKIGLHPKIFDREMECMGFLPADIEKYVHDYCASLQADRQPQQLIDFLKSHPHLWGSAHIPIQLELICWSWTHTSFSARAEHIKTLTQLYQEIVRELKYRQFHPDKQLIALTKPQATQALHFLSYLAHAAMQAQLILLSGEFVKAAIKQYKQDNNIDINLEVLLKACLQLGFLNKTTGLINPSTLQQNLLHHTYCFIHLSFQEFFAARFYQQKLLSLISRDNAVEKIAQIKYEPRYQLIWRFTFGLLYQTAKRNSKSKNLMGLYGFLQALIQNPRDEIGIYHFSLIIPCIDECGFDINFPILAELLEEQLAYLHIFSRNVFRIQLSNSEWVQTFKQCIYLLSNENVQNKILQLIISEFNYNRNINGDLLTLFFYVPQLADGPRDKLFNLAMTAIREKSHENLLFERLIMRELASRKELTKKQRAECFEIFQNSFDSPHNKESNLNIHSSMGEGLARRTDLSVVETKIFLKLLKYPGKSRMVENYARKFGLHINFSEEGIQREFVEFLITASSDSLVATLLHPNIDLPKAIREQLLKIIQNEEIIYNTRLAVSNYLAQRSDLTKKERNILFNMIFDKNNILRASVAERLAARLDLTQRERTQLWTMLENLGSDYDAQDTICLSFVSRPDLTKDEWMQLWFMLQDKLDEYSIQITLMTSFRIRNDLTLSEKENLLEGLKEELLVSKDAIGSLMYLDKLQDILLGLLHDKNQDVGIRRAAGHILAEYGDLSDEKRRKLCDLFIDPQVDISIREGIAWGIGEISPSKIPDDVFRKMLEHPFVDDAINKQLLIRWFLLDPYVFFEKLAHSKNAPFTAEGRLVLYFLQWYPSFIANDILMSYSDNEKKLFIKTKNGLYKLSIQSNPFFLIEHKYMLPIEHQNRIQAHLIQELEKFKSEENVVLTALKDKTTKKSSQPKSLTIHIGNLTTSSVHIGANNNYSSSSLLNMPPEHTQTVTIKKCCAEPAIPQPALTQNQQGEKSMLNESMNWQEVELMLKKPPYLSCTELTSYYHFLQQETEHSSNNEATQRELALLKEKLIIFIGTMKLKTYQQYADILSLSSINEVKIKEALFMRFYAQLSKKYLGDYFLPALCQLFEEMCYTQTPIKQDVLNVFIVQLIEKAAELADLGAGQEQSVKDVLQTIFFALSIFEQHYSSLSQETLELIKGNLLTLENLYSFDASPSIYFLIEQLQNKRHLIKKNVTPMDRAQHQHRVAPESRHAAVDIAKGSGQILVGAALLSAAITGAVLTAGTLSFTVVPAARLFADWSIKGGLKQYYRGFRHVYYAHRHYQQSQVLNNSLAVTDLDKEALERLHTELTKQDVKDNLFKIQDAAEGAEIIQRLSDILFYSNPTDAHIVSGIVLSIFKQFYNLSVGSSKTRDKKLQAFILAKSDELSQAGFEMFPGFSGEFSGELVKQFAQAFLSISSKISEQDWEEYIAMQHLSHKQQQAHYKANTVSTTEFNKKFKRVERLARRLKDLLSAPNDTVTNSFDFDCSPLWNMVYGDEILLLKNATVLYGKLSNEIPPQEEGAVVTVLQDYCVQYQIRLNNSNVLVSSWAHTTLTMFGILIEQHPLYKFANNNKNERAVPAVVGSLAHFGYWEQHAGSLTEFIEEDVDLGPETSIEDMIAYKKASADLNFQNDKRRKEYNVGITPLVTADKIDTYADSTVKFKRLALSRGKNSVLNATNPHNFFTPAMRNTEQMIKAEPAEIPQEGIMAEAGPSQTRRNVTTPFL